MERPQYNGRGTVMTAPVRYSAPTPERDAPRGSGDGMVAFGRGVQNLAGGLEQRQHNLKAVADEKKRIDDRDMERFLKRASIDAHDEVRKKYENLNEMLPDQIQDPINDYNDGVSSRLKNYRRLNPTGELPPEYLNLFMAQESEKYAANASDNKDKLRVAERYAGITAEVGDALMAMTPVTSKEGGTTALSVADATMDYVKNLPETEVTPEFRTSMIKGIIRDVNQNFAASIYGATTENRDTMLANAQEAVDKGYMGQPDFVQFKAQLENRIKERSVFDTESTKEVLRQKGNQLVSGTDEGDNLKQSVKEFVDAKTFLVGKGKGVGAPAKQAIVREALIASLDGHVQRGTRKLSSQVLPSSRFSPVADATAEQIASSFSYQFTNAENGVMLANVKQLMRDAGTPDEAEGGWEAVESITIDEARQWTGRTQTILNQRVEMINRGQSNVLVEQTEGLQAALDEANGKIQKIMNVYRARNARLGVDPNKAVNLPSDYIVDMAKSLSAKDPGTRVAAVTAMATELGMEALTGLRSMGNVKQTDKEGRPTDKPLLSEEQIAAAHLAIIPQISHNATKASRQKALDFSYLANEAIDATDNIEVSKTKLPDDWTKFKAQMESSYVQSLLKPYILAAQYDPYGGPSFGKALPNLITKIAEHNFSRNGTSSNPMKAIDDAFKVVAASIIPVRNTSDGTESYSFMHSSRYYESSFGQFRQPGQSDDVRQYQQAMGAMGDLPFSSGTSAGEDQVSPLFWMENAIAKSYLGNLFGITSDSYGKASLIATERVIGFDTELDPQMVGVASVSRPRYSNFGAMNIDFGNVYIANGNDAPIRLSDAVAMEHSSWGPKEVLLRIKAQLKGLEKADPETITRVVLGKNHQYVENYQKGTRELYLIGAKVDGVKQAGSLIRVMKKDAAGQFVPLAIPLADFENSYNIGSTSAINYIRDTSPLTNR